MVVCLAVEEVRVDGDSWEITHRYDESLIEEMCKLRRAEGDNGFSDDKSHRHIAMIPRHRYFSDIELILHNKNQGVDDEKADYYFRLWLAKNPQFKTCSGRI